MKKFFALFALLSFSAFSAEIKKLPPIQPPAELIETSSEFAEGTITRLTQQDIDVFVPWAQNAQKVLTKALTDIETMPVRMQVDHLNNVMKSVIRRSGQKSYQMFMRFALNRAMLLVQELTKEADTRDNGILENALDIQVKAIKVALDVYESDLSFQRRAQDGNDTVKLEYAKFGLMFGKSMLTAITSVFDASAQYRLLYKTLEIVNWDLSRDDNALTYADQIINIYNTLTTNDEQPSRDDLSNLFAIRRLNVHVEELSLLVPSTDTAVVTVERGAAEFRAGNRVMTTGESPEYVTITEVRASTVVLKFPNGAYGEWNKSSVAFLSGCVEKICIGDKMINISRSYYEVTVLAITQDNKFILNFNEGDGVKGKRGSGWSPSDLATMKGCSGDICVGDNVYNLQNNKKATVVAIKDGKFVLLFLEGDIQGKKGGMWERNNVTKIQ